MIEPDDLQRIAIITVGCARFAPHVPLRLGRNEIGEFTLSLRADRTNQRCPIDLIFFSTIAVGYVFRGNDPHNDRRTCNPDAIRRARGNRAG